MIFNLKLLLDSYFENFKNLWTVLLFASHSLPLNFPGSFTTHLLPNFISSFCFKMSIESNWWYPRVRDLLASTGACMGSLRVASLPSRKGTPFFSNHQWLIPPQAGVAPQEPRDWSSRQKLGWETLKWSAGTFLLFIQECWFCELIQVKTDWTCSKSYNSSQRALFGLSAFLLKQIKLDFDKLPN